MPEDDYEARQQRADQGISSEIVPVAGTQAHLPERLRTTEPFFRKTVEKVEVIPETVNGVTTYRERRIERIDLSHVQIQDKVYWKDEDSSPKAIDAARNRELRNAELEAKMRVSRRKNNRIARSFTKDETDASIRDGVELYETGAEDIDHLYNPNLGNG